MSQPSKKTQSSQTAMNRALAASLDAEASSFQSRLQRADAVMGQASPEEKTSEVRGREERAPIPRVIRDAFTMPEEDYKLIAEAQDRCLTNAVRATKSEVLRAGLQALSQMNDEQLKAAIGKLNKVPTGRPKSSNG